MEGWRRELTWKQLMLWVEFERLEPDGEDKEVREDLRAGVVAAQVANTALNFGFAKGERYRADHFFPSLVKVREEQERRQQEQTGKMGKVITKEEFERWKEDLKSRGRRRNQP